ncbi:hypothetical protein AALC17_15150 [Oscillospiraceae bacterium 38-13]
MKKIRHIRSFLSGAAAALAAAACLTTALAASGSVKYNFANVALDGQQKITAGQDITAANGQKVPGSILYTDEAGGKTNYLPIRTVSELLGVEIGYDSATKTILIGKQAAPAAPAAPEAGEVIDLRTPKEVPENPRRGDAELIKSRGGTILPDEDLTSYVGNDKLFRDKNGELRREYLVGNKDALQEIDKKAAEWSLVNDDYPKNSKGESYGSMLLADYVGHMPDLHHLAAYPPEGRPEGYIREAELQKGGEALKGLSKEECPHWYSIPLYNSEGNVIGEYKVGCEGHYDTEGLTPEEAREVIMRGPTW